ncbi:MAG: endonuclease IV [Firmicutes bacterium HGW-Firmicutes-12]|jgi:deoxyribonuclease-4|nr:MAG: endonuclease IV [Firmicutes bacterium HGW-Firmicutes-12]
MFIGAHVSISQGLLGAVKAAVEMKANTFQFFTRNPRGGQARKLDVNDIQKAHELMEQYSFGPFVGHAPYTYNLASAKPGVREFSIRTLKDDVARAKTIRLPYIVLHPGTHGGQGEERGLQLVVQGLKDVLAEIDSKTYILIEGMVGEGTELGYSFGHLKSILEGCDYHSQLGICLDSAHLTGAGYDLERWDDIKEEFDQMIGLNRLRAFHFNDTMYPLGSKRDRHAKLGEGHLAIDILKKVISDKDLQKVSFILETPNDNEGYAHEIALIKEWNNI